MYNKIYDFCKVRNLGNIYKNDPNQPTPRVKFILSLLVSEGIDYELDKFEIEGNNNLNFNFRSFKKLKRDEPKEKLYGYNIIMKGSSDKMVVAHHDVNNHTIDNANDNSASVINAIMVKKLMPNINVVLLDGEEFGGLGSKRASEQINSGYYGNIKWVLNLELSGKGGDNFFIGNYKGPLFDHIKKLFNCKVYNTPFNDSVEFRKNGIDSCVINPLPVLSNGDLDYSMLFNCHNSKDTVSTIDPNDMRIFVENVLCKILQ